FPRNALMLFICTHDAIFELAPIVEELFFITIRCQRNIEAVLDETLKWLGSERFSGMKVTELEKVVRSRAGRNALPGRSQLRAAIHVFRVKRWPGTAPRRRS